MSHLGEDGEKIEEKDTRTIARIIVLIAVIVAAVSIVMPWKGFGMNFMGMNLGADIFPWGMHAYANIPAYFNSTSTSGDVWSILYSWTVGSMGSSTASTTTQPPNSTAVGLFLAGLVVLIIAIIIGILSIKRVNTRRGLLPLIAGIGLILAIILFIAGSQVAFTTTQSTSVPGFQWSTGFYLVVIAMILFFTAFGIIRFVKTTPTPAPSTAAPAPPAAMPPQDNQTPPNP